MVRILLDFGNAVQNGPLEVELHRAADGSHPMEKPDT